MSAAAEESVVWIKTEPSLDGTTYTVTIEADADRAIVLTPDTALAYASAVLGAAARAEYDAAVYRQLCAFDLEVEAVAQMITDLRRDRPPLDTAATKPLALEPGVNAKGEPFLVVLVEEDRVGQWSVPAAREHALIVLEAVAVADLDAGYLQALRGLIGLDEDRARAVVGDLGNHRGGPS